MEKLYRIFNSNNTKGNHLIPRVRLLACKAEVSIELATGEKFYASSSFYFEQLRYSIKRDPLVPIFETRVSRKGVGENDAMFARVTMPLTFEMNLN